MNKKLIILAALLIVVLLGGGGYYLYSRQQWLESKEPTPGTVTPPKLPTKEWKDPLGFTLEYADYLALNPHPEDQENYAHLEFMLEGSKGSDGAIIIWAKDPPDGTLEEWVSSQDYPANALMIDTTWGGIKAKKISVGGKEPVTHTIVIYDDLLFLAQLYPDAKGKLAEAYDQMLSDFKWQSINSGETPGSETGSSFEDAVIEDTGSIDQSMDNAEYSEEEVVE